MDAPGLASDRLTSTELVNAPPLGAMTGVVRNTCDAENRQGVLRAHINFAARHRRHGEFHRAARIVARQVLAGVVKLRARFVAL